MRMNDSNETDGDTKKIRNKTEKPENGTKKSENGNEKSESGNEKNLNEVLLLPWPLDRTSSSVAALSRVALSPTRNVRGDYTYNP